jgi:hypothetical protein
MARNGAAQLQRDSWASRLSQPPLPRGSTTTTWTAPRRRHCVLTLRPKWRPTAPHGYIHCFACVVTVQSTRLRPWVLSRSNLSLVSGFCNLIHHRGTTQRSALSIALGMLQGGSSWYATCALPNDMRTVSARAALQTDEPDGDGWGAHFSANAISLQCRQTSLTCMLLPMPARCIIRPAISCWRLQV